METRTRILNKANEICRKVGFRAMTLDEIAAQLSISKKTIYQYFDDKDALVDAIMDIEINKTKVDCIECTKRAENAIHEILLSHEKMAEEMKETNSIVLHDLQRFYYPTYLKLMNLKNEFFAHLISNNLTRGIKEGYYEKDIDIDILTKLRLESILLPINQDVFPAKKYDFVHVSRVMLIHFIRGIVTDKGLELLEKFKRKYK